MNRPDKDHESQKTTEPNPIDIQVGERLKSFRKAWHISQTELAKALGISFQQIHKYETARNRISASMLVAMADYFKLPVQAFFEDDTASLQPSPNNSDDT